MVQTRMSRAANGERNAIDPLKLATALHSAKKKTRRAQRTKVATRVVATSTSTRTSTTTATVATGTAAVSTSPAIPVLEISAQLNQTFDFGEEEAGCSSPLDSSGPLPIAQLTFELTDDEDVTDMKHVEKAKQSGKPAVSKPKSKPVAKAPPKPVVKEVVKPLTKSVVKPATKSAVKPAVKSVVKPATTSAVKPAVKAVVKPATKSAVKPAIKPPLKALKRANDLADVISKPRGGRIEKKGKVHPWADEVKQKKLNYKPHTGPVPPLFSPPPKHLKGEGPLSSRFGITAALAKITSAGATKRLSMQKSSGLTPHRGTLAPWNPNTTSVLMASTTPETVREHAKVHSRKKR